MEECSVLIETTKSAEDKTSRWLDLPIDYELFRDLLGVEADSGDYQIIDMKLPFAGDIVRTTCTRMAEKRIDVKLADTKNKKISTHLLIMEVDFCPGLCILEVPVLQAFRGISHFVWYCKAVSDLS